MSLHERIRVRDARVLSDDSYVLKKTSFEWRRSDGEWQEETGYRLHQVTRVFEAFMSPGSVTETLHFFVGEYEPGMRVGDGGGMRHEGEDIEVLEVGMDEAPAMVADGRICDGNTIMLLQCAALHLFGPATEGGLS